MIAAPYYRTFEGTFASIAYSPLNLYAGFRVLFEKEWTLAAHPFFDRLIESFGTVTLYLFLICEAPIFIQFLDCIHQLLLQNPSSFEYNEQFLLHIADAAVSGLFGNFLHWYATSCS
jgi:myotubularin-related protein 3/4